MYVDLVEVNTPQLCIDACAKYNYKYAALQNEYQCWCGDKYGRYGRSNDKCFLECPGDKIQNCGGQFANNIYEIYEIGICKIFIVKN